MYEKRFGLHRKPFQAVQKQSDYFPSAAYRDLLPAVLNALQSDLGVAVLTGPAGVGKTVALESFRRALDPNAQTLFIRGGSVRGAEDLLYALHRHVLKVQNTDHNDNSSNVVRRWDLVQRLQRLSEFWGPLTILIDDVHLVDVEVFSELRTLLEEEAGGLKLIRLLIAGPLLLEEVLAQPTMGDFAQKIRTHVFLEPLRSSESVGYLAHHVKNAGGTLDELFQPTAVEKIIVAADGIPRCLNLLADESLMVCEETDMRRVSPEVVSTALTRLLHLPVTWNASADDHDSDHDSEALETETVESGSVVEIGGATEVVSHGVIEIGGPAHPEKVVEQNNFDPEEFVAPIAAADIEPISDCCEFIPDESQCRDTDLIESISEISAAIGSMEQQSTDFTVDDDLSGAVEVSSEEFYSEPVIEYVETAPEQNANGWGPTQLSASDESDEVVPAPDSTAEIELPESKIDDDIDDLEHHLLLASSVPDEHNTFLDDATESDEATFENEHLFEAILAKVETPHDTEDMFSSYDPWEPAGMWPPVLPDQPEGAYSYADLGNATPLFDRYTWCELGRDVSAGTACRLKTVPDHVTLLEWPPNVDQIAPDESIPITIVTEEDADELLPRLTEVVGSTSTTDSDNVDSESLTVHYTPGESLALPELKFDFSPSHDASYVAGEKDSGDDDASNPKHESSPASISDTLRLPEQASDKPDDRKETISLSTDGAADDRAGSIDATDHAGHQNDCDHVASIHSGIPTGKSSDSLSSDQDSTGDLSGQSSSDVAALIANVVERFISDAGTDSETTLPAAGGPGTSGDSEETLITELESEEHSKEESLNEYAPQLLREARARVMSVLATQGQLRQAAGAENTSFAAEEPDETTDTRPYLSISRPLDDAIQAEEMESEDHEEEISEAESPLGSMISSRVSGDSESERRSEQGNEYSRRNEKIVLEAVLTPCMRCLVDSWM